MLSEPFAECESRFDGKLSTLSREKDTECDCNSWVRLGEVGTVNDGFGTQDLEANTEFRHSAFSRAMSAEQPFDVRSGWRKHIHQKHLVDATRNWRREREV